MDPSSKLLICRLLSTATIELELQSDERDELFAELIEKIPGIAYKPEAKKTLLKAVVEREQMHSTGLGDGLAIPHARNAIAGVTDHAVIVAGRHPEGIPYGAIDQAPVRLFFLLIAPNITEHLHILARLSRLLRDSNLRNSLLAARTRDEVIDRICQAEEKL